MEHLITSWPQAAHEIRQRHFTASPLSELYIYHVRAHPDRSVQFTWTYVWLDMGMYNTHSCTVLVTHGEAGTLLVHKSTASQPNACDLASMEASQPSVCDLAALEASQPSVWDLASLEAMCDLASLEASQPSVCDLASLEDACFRDECEACHRENLLEITGDCYF